MSKRRVVVTGLGIVSPVGSTVDTAWDAVLNGRSGIAPVTRFDVSAFPVRFGGAVKDFDVAQYIPPKEARRMDEFMHYGVAAGIQAVTDSGIDFTKTDPALCGAICGAGIGGLWTIEEDHNEYLKANSPRKISPFFIPGAIINMITSFDVWKQGHNPIEIYGAEGTLFVPDPNGFGGPVKLAKGGVPSPVISECPLSHIYTENSRSIGTADMAYALQSGRKHRCSGALAFHVLEIMESFEKSSLAGKHIELTTTCERPAALPLGLQDGLLDL